MSVPRISWTCWWLFVFCECAVVPNKTWIAAKLATLQHELPPWADEALRPDLITDVSDESVRLRDLGRPMRWALDDVEHEFTPACATTVRQHNRFELAWASYVRLHRDIASGAQLPPRFVHIAFPPEASWASRLKGLVNAVLFGLLTDRAAVVSWVPTPQSDGYAHSALIELLRSPGFDWWYMPHKYADAKFQRFSARGFGQEDGDRLTHEPEQFMCSDLANDASPWIELHWKNDAFGAALYRNPFLRPRAAQLFAPDDFFGPIARKLLRPQGHVWKRFTKLYRRYFAKESVRRTSKTLAHVTARLHVVGIELNKPADAPKARACFTKRSLKARSQQVSSDNSVRVMRYFLSAPTVPHLVINETLRHLGPDRTFRYENDDLLCKPGLFQTRYPGEQRELVEELLLQFSDTILVPRGTERSRHFLFSQRAVVYDHDYCADDTQCQPCFSWKSFDKFACYDKAAMGVPDAHCEHSVWYRW